MRGQRKRTNLDRLTKVPRARSSRAAPGTWNTLLHVGLSAQKTFTKKYKMDFSSHYHDCLRMERNQRSRPQHKKMNDNVVKTVFSKPFCCVSQELSCGGHSRSCCFDAEEAPTFAGSAHRCRLHSCFLQCLTQRCGAVSWPLLGGAFTRTHSVGFPSALLRVLGFYLRFFTTQKK